MYESRAVFQPLKSKQEFLDYIAPKLQTVSRTGATVFAEMGEVLAFRRRQPCVVLAQHEKSNLVALVLARAEADRLKRLDLCIIPPPESAIRSGEYPM